MRLERIGALSLVLALVATAGVGCRRVDLGESGYLRQESQSVALDGATEARVDIAMGAGDLRMSSASMSTNLLESSLEYAPADIAPEFSYEVVGTEGRLNVRQSEGRTFRLGEYVNSWDLRIARGLPVDLEVSMGAGESNLDLAGVDLTDLRVTMGAGSATVDLSGARTRDLSARIEAGAGTITVNLPKDVGVRVSGIKDGVGDWNLDGLTSSGDAFVNDAYGRSPVTIDLFVTRGVGTVNLTVED